MGKRKTVALLSIYLVSCDCCVALPRGAMRLFTVVIVIFPDHTHLLFLTVLTIVTNLTIFCVC